MATTLWTNLCQPNGAWVTLHSCDSGSHRIAKSSVHRLVQAIERRHQYPESPCGNQWLPVVTQIGLGSGVCVRSQAGIGNEMFFHILHLEGRIGV